MLPLSRLHWSTKHTKSQVYLANNKYYNRDIFPLPLPLTLSLVFVVLCVWLMLKNYQSTLFFQTNLKEIFSYSSNSQCGEIFLHFTVMHYQKMIHSYLAKNTFLVSFVFFLKFHFINYWWFIVTKSLLSLSYLAM